MGTGRMGAAVPARYVPGASEQPVNRSDRAYGWKDYSDTKEKAEAARFGFFEGINVTLLFAFVIWYAFIIQGNCDKNVFIR